MERSQPKDQDLWEVLTEESYSVGLKENPIYSNQKIVFQVGALIFMVLALPFLHGSRKEGSCALSQIEKGDLVALKPIKPVLNIRVVSSAFFSLPKHENF